MFDDYRGEVAPIIVSALFGAEDLAWLDDLRRTHFPPERNYLSAHLTLFHHLPSSRKLDIERRLDEATRTERPTAEAAALINLGRGVAVRIKAPRLSTIRADLALAFADLLTPQDASSWRPHVTIQNKVQPAEARALLSMLGQNFQPQPVVISGLAAWRYRGGPWEPISQYLFRR